MKVFLIVALAFIFTIHIFAQLEGNPENFCRNGFFPRESDDYRLAKVQSKKGEKVYFYSDENDCPNGKNCRRKSYVILSDEVIVSRAFGNWACSWFQPKRGSETVGWIDAGKLEFVDSNKNPEIRDWIGEWSYYDSSIKIKQSKNAGVFDIKGNAFWKGLGDNVHVGEIDDRVKPQGNLLKIGDGSEDEYECKVMMRLLGKYLIVSDNLRCGGVNVTFSGIYLKK